MEGRAPEDGSVERESRRSAARRRLLLLRRLAAVCVAAIALAAIGLLVLRGGSGEDAEPAGSPPSGVAEPVARLVERMTTAERVDQVLLTGFEGTEASVAAPVVEAGQRGGVLVGSRNWLDATQGRALLSGLRAAAREGGGVPPLFVAAQEGGEYRALPDLPPETRELDIGRTGDPDAAEAWARTSGTALRSVGIDLNLSPVADVATLDSPLAGRAFSDDVALSAGLTAAAIRGCEAAGIGCAPLHFPGQGAASQDTADGPATVSLDPATLADRDLAVFQAAFGERAPAVVLSLAFFAAYDSVTPAALAPEVATGLLRDQLGYEGVALTDDLSSGAIKATTNVPDAAVAAVAAGADMVQISLPGDQRKVAEALLQAVESGEIPEERLSEAAGRVVGLKRRLGLLRR